jgi:hypothetical protein
MRSRCKSNPDALSGKLAHPNKEKPAAREVLPVEMLSD